ncbi:MAG: hypothetical protein U0L08_00840, partial [Bacteroidales bacterium]|nr:hypothetical protein [Bacteroidales bacterium]
ASGSRDKTVIVWDANSGAILQTMKGHTFGVNCVSWSPDGKYLASASWDMSIVLWNPNNGRNLQTLKGHTFSVESLCWTPDGKYLISGAGDQTVRIWSEEAEYIYREVPLPDRKPERDVVNEERDVVNEDSKPEIGVETEQAQIEKPAKKVIKKSIEKTESKILIKEYDQQGKLIKMTKRDTDLESSIEFSFKDGTIASAKASGSSYSDASVDKQNNTATYYNWSEIRIGFNKFGYSKIENLEWGSEDIYEYNEAGLLVRIIGSYEGFGSDEFVACENETTFSYDVNNQDWTKRTETQTSSCISNKTKKKKVMGTSTSTTTRTVEYW